MRRTTFQPLRFGLFFFAALLAFASIIEAGPPLLCHPFEIGGAKSLPWEKSENWNSPKAGYDITNLVPETMSLLSSDTGVIIRMETLRRATLYASGIYRGNDGWKNQSDEDRRIAYELLSRLMARALAESPGSLASFDAGYLMSCYEQANITKDFKGYELVKKALAVNGQNPEIEFACALITVWPKNAEHGQHLQKAKAAAQKNSLLAANLESHFGNGKAQ